MRDRAEKKANGDSLEWRRLTFTHERTHTHWRSLKFVVTHWKQCLWGRFAAGQSDYRSLWNESEEVAGNPILLPVTVCPDAASNVPEAFSSLEVLSHVLIWNMMKPFQLNSPVGREIQEDPKFWTRQADLFSDTDNKSGGIGHQRWPYNDGFPLVFRDQQCEKTAAIYDVVHLKEHTSRAVFTWKAC